MGPVRTKRREGLVLVVSAISVAALVGAGVSSYGDPDLAGQAALARLSGEVANGVVVEWERLRREPELLGPAPLRWASEPAPEATAARAFEPRESNVVVDALLAEARRLDQEETAPQAALEVLLEALSKDPDDERRALIRLRILQLAARNGEDEQAREQWSFLRAELRGDEALEHTSILLLGALALAPALALEEAAALRDELVDLWIEGSLALPPESFTGNPLRAAYRRRLQELVPESAGDPRLPSFALRTRARALAELLGEPVSAPKDGALGIRWLPGDGASQPQELVFRRLDPDTLEGRLLPRGTMAAQLTAAVEDAGQLPPRFAIDPDGDLEDAGSVVRTRTALAHSPLGFLVRHTNPESVVSAVGERQALLRAALFTLAVGVGAAGFSVYRALARERHLADLKSTFVANVSHELRTPVSSILLMAENLEQERVLSPETRKRYHGLIRREAERLRRLVDDVLDFSRIERGKGVHLALAEVQVAEFARELEEEVRGRVEADQGTLRYTCNGVPARVMADRDALRRATLNLVDNALKHSGQSEVELSLGSAPRDGLSIQVRDRGAGVASARMESLFRPFERQESDDGSAGTGLGLAIVREIAEGHGGRARALEADGPGLALEITIPGQPAAESGRKP